MDKEGNSCARDDLRYTNKRIQTVITIKNKVHLEK